MNKTTADICFFLVILSLFSIPYLSNANYTINTTQSIAENQTLVSPGGRFELGFFSPGNSKNWYFGLWYRSITPKTVVWVANRENPLKNSTSGVFKIIEPGLLVILNETNSIVWSSNNSGRPTQNPVAQLLDSGNLVLRDEKDDRPENYLSSWRNNEDPAPGDYSLHLDPAKDSERWARADWSNGCVRRTELNCTAGDGFLKYSGIKLPEAKTSWYNESMVLQKCEEECSKNCSCTAYTVLDVTRRSGCLLWFVELVDIRLVSLSGEVRFSP